MFKDQLITISTFHRNLFAKGDIVECSLYGLLKTVKVIDDHTIRIKKLNWFEFAMYYIKQPFVNLWRRIAR